MSGLDKDRKRNQTVCFRMTPEERRELEARIKVSGLAKSGFRRHSWIRLIGYLRMKPWWIRLQRGCED